MCTCDETHTHTHIRTKKNILTLKRKKKHSRTQTPGRLSFHNKLVWVWVWVTTILSLSLSRNLSLPALLRQVSICFHQAHIFTPKQHSHTPKGKVIRTLTNFRYHPCKLSHIHTKSKKKTSRTHDLWLPEFPRRVSTCLRRHLFAVTGLMRHYQQTGSGIYPCRGNFPAKNCRVGFKLCHDFDVNMSMEWVNDVHTNMTLNSGFWCPYVDGMS